MGFFIIKPRHTEALEKKQIWVENPAMGPLQCCHSVVMKY